MAFFCIGYYIPITLVTINGVVRVHVDGLSPPCAEAPNHGFIPGVGRVLFTVQPSTPNPSHIHSERESSSRAATPEPLYFDTVTRGRLLAEPPIATCIA